MLIIGSGCCGGSSSCEISDYRSQKTVRKYLHGCFKEAQSSEYKMNVIKQTSPVLWLHHCLNLNKSFLYLCVEQIEKILLIPISITLTARSATLFFPISSPLIVLKTWLTLWYRHISLKRLGLQWGEALCVGKLCRPCPCRSNRWWCRRASLWAAAGFVNRGTQTVGCTSHPTTAAE